MTVENETLSTKRGYLKEDFKFYHLKDQKNMQFEFHYHDFHKIIVFISGNVTYLLEGKSYKLKPWDILFVSSNEIHKPIIDSNEAYERIVVWVNSRFLEKHNADECNLLTCFNITSMQKFNLLRLNPETLKLIKIILQQLEDAYKNDDFGSHILRNAFFIQLVVYLNRMLLGTKNVGNLGEVGNDERIDEILDYINVNLNGDLSIDKLSAMFFVSKYYLMHRFKAQTGYTIHNYILRKRLILANSMIKDGRTAAEACMECGFGDYSSFVRAFKNVFGMSPKKHYKALMELERAYSGEIHK